MIKDLRDFIAKCEEIGELKRVKTEVDWDLEAVHLADLNDEREGPAILYENVKDSDFPLLIGALSSPKRCALALDMPLDYSPVDMAREWKERVRREKIPPRVVTDGPVMENVVEEKDADLLKLPVPRFYPGDGGRYIGSNAVLITQDPDDGWTNVGVYRMMVHDSKNICISILPSKHGFRMMKRYHELGKPMPAAIAIGELPVLFLFASAGVPWGVSEYDTAGAVRNEPIEVVKSDLTGLSIPARAEWIIEGEISGDQESWKPEGPFGEFTGYYSGLPGKQWPAPCLKVKRIMHRNNAILWSQSVGSIGPGKNVTPSIQISASIWSELENMGIPGIKAVYCPQEAGGRLMCVVSVKQEYSGNALQVGHAVVASRVGAYRSKVIIIVDDDIPPDKIDRVLWAVANRSDAERSTHVFKRTHGSVLDPGLPIGQRDVASKLIIDATMPYEWKEKPVMVELDPKMVEKVEKRWKEYGLD